MNFFDHFYSLDRKDVANLLIAKGADVSAEDSFGRTPLVTAINKGMKNVIENLIQKGANGMRTV